MKTEIYYCDNCRKTTATPSMENMWITVEAFGESYSTLTIKETVETPKRINERLVVNSVHSLHFCCRDCFFKFFKKAFNMAPYDDDPI